jgi:Cytochrome c-type biogenesis protein CcmF C-terminal
VRLAPLTMGVGAGVVVFAMGLRQWYVLTALSLAAFALGTVVVEFRRGVSARRHLVHETPARALVNLVAKNNRRYGGYIIHLGVVFAFIGIVASSFFGTEVKRSVREGQSFNIGAYEITFLGLKGVETAHLEDLRARLPRRTSSARREDIRIFIADGHGAATKPAMTDAAVLRTEGEYGCRRGLSWTINGTPKRPTGCCELCLLKSTRWLTNFHLRARRRSSTSFSRISRAPSCARTCPLSRRIAKTTGAVFARLPKRSE